MSLVSFIKKSRIEKKYLIRKHFFPNRISSDLFVDYLKEKGVSIGEGTIFFDPGHTGIDIQRPFGLKIGKYSKITSGVSILCHDYSRSVLMQKYKQPLCEFKETIIGDNVFIGINSIILMGTHLGNNTIVGAGAVVTGTFPDDVVIAGNPAKIICPLNVFFEKRKKAQLREAKEWVRSFSKRFNRLPSEKEMGAFFYLFEGSVQSLDENKIWYKWNGVDYRTILEESFKAKPAFDSFEDFLLWAQSDNDLDLNKLYEE